MGLLPPDPHHGVNRGRPRVARLMLPVGCHGHPAVALESGRVGDRGRQHAVNRGRGVDKRAVGWNDGAGHGVDWFALDELVGNFPSPGVHPARVGACVERHQVEYDMKEG